MKRISFLLALFFTTSVFASWRSESRAILKEHKTECKNAEVVVDEIVRDSHIKGHVVGLSPEAYSDFKVVFYVKTNRWYVHPYTYYEGQDEGFSYSNLTADGEFQVKTLRRDMPSKQMAVVLVPKTYKINSQRLWLKPLFGFIGGVLKYQCNHTIVKGTGEFFQ